MKDDFWYGNAFVLQLHTGLRPHELMALIWEDVDFERGILRIERGVKWLRGVVNGFGPLKNKESKRLIGLTPEHLALLKAQHAKQQQVIEEYKAKGLPYGEPKLKEWVLRERLKQSHRYASARLIFPQRDGRAPNHTTPRTEFKTMLQRAGIQSGATNYRWYDLRHTHASFLLAFGLPASDVAEQMGHSVEILTSTYTHFLESRRSVAAALFVKHIPVEIKQPMRSTEHNAAPREQLVNDNRQLTFLREGSDDEDDT